MVNFERTAGDDRNGGQLNISIAEVPTPTVSVTINRLGSFNSRTGYVTVSGTYTCTNGSKFAGGKALAVTLGFACGQVECTTEYAEQTVLLSGKKSAGATEDGGDGAGNLLFLQALSQ